MRDAISIRAYSKKFISHSHPYFQFVFPINGSIDVQVGHYAGPVGVGEGIVMMKGQEHGFKAHEHARFIVLDVARVTERVLQLPSPKFVVSKPMMAFLNFAELQLVGGTGKNLEADLIAYLHTLLESEPLNMFMDRRLAPVFAHINENLAQALPIKSLAALACLGETQFKKRFVQCVDMTPGAYILDKRMNKAMALLRYTDMPVSHIAEQVGYGDFSAFSRRFHGFFGRPPRYFASKS